MESSGKKVVVSLVVLLFMAGAGVLVYYLARDHFLSPPPSPKPPPADAPDGGKADPTQPAPPPAPSPGAPRTVRPDDGSIRSLAGMLTKNQEFARWLDTNHLLGKFVAVVELISRGKSPAKILHFMEPEGKFPVFERGEKEFLDLQGYRRYDLVAQAFASLDAQKCAELIDGLMPALNTKYQEMARPDEDFRTALTLAMAELLQVPAIEREIPLERISVTLKIAIPELEAMSPAQKHLFRMGPVNITRVQTKLREIGRALGLSEELDSVIPITIAP